MGSGTRRGKGASVIETPPPRYQRPRRPALLGTVYGDSLNLTREEEKAYSQNFGHESIRMTRESYGTLPAHRQAEIMRALAKPRVVASPDGIDVAALESVLISVKRMVAAKNSSAL